MCYREVHCTRHSCGHETPHGERRMDCGSSRCRYSANHSAHCGTCTKTCKQWLRPAQTLVTAKAQTPCFHCSTRRS
ncbi:hypothetical protein FPV67DRAFT_275564 [Lyophyllum atratum]|nr:hypothetical protein FPV67DRAFT_275564 [Lyophyllum atratum]